MDRPEDEGFGDGQAEQLTYLCGVRAENEKLTTDSDPQQAQDTCTPPLCTLREYQKRVRPGISPTKTLRGPTLKKPAKVPVRHNTFKNSGLDTSCGNAGDKKMPLPLFRRTRVPQPSPSTVNTDCNKSNVLTHVGSCTSSTFGSSLRIPEIGKEELMATKLRLERYKQRLQDTLTYELLDEDDNTETWPDRDTDTEACGTLAETLFPPMTSAYAQAVMKSRLLPLALRLQQLHVGPAPCTSLRRADANRMTDFDTLFGVGGGTAQALRKEGGTDMWHGGHPVSYETPTGSGCDFTDEKDLSTLKGYECDGGCDMRLQGDEVMKGDKLLHINRGGQLTD